MSDARMHMNRSTDPSGTQRLNRIILKSIDSVRKGSPTSSLFTKNKESIEQLLTRKLKLKYLDNNPAFHGDPWMVKNREVQFDLAAKSQVGFGRLNHQRNTDNLLGNQQDKFRKSMVAFGNSTLPKIKGGPQLIDS